MSEHPLDVHGPPPGEKRHVWDDPENVRRLIRVFWVACGLLLLVDLLVHRHLSFKQGELPVEGWFGFYPFYGFVACVLLVVIAKQMRKVLIRDEDYYDDADGGGAP